MDDNSASSLSPGTSTASEAASKVQKPKAKTTKPRKRASILSEDQKKKHHIESEHKRRQAIRDAFTKLVDLVPELDVTDSRSEIIILTKSAEYLKQLYHEHVSLMVRLSTNGQDVDEKLRLEIPESLKNDGAHEGKT